MLRNIFLLSLPFLAILLSYFVLDPFRVLYHYQRFDEPLVAIPNRDYISTQMYLNTNAQRRYNSFILGNSRTLAFHVSDWTPYLHNASAFHYDASGESLYGVWKKLEFLKENGSAIQNALLVCDAELLAKTDDFDTHILRKDPRVVGALPLAFQLSFVKAYLANNFFYTYSKWLVTKQMTPDMAQVLESRHVYYDPQTNDLILPDLEAEIKRDSLGFYARNSRLKIARKPGVNAAVIGAAQLRQLIAIRNIVKAEHTNFQLVISPLFNQKQLNPADLAILQRTFGAANVHDFSGNNSITSNPGNYYEESHYRPFIGRQLLRQIYRPAK
jgi:hypothetical protein